MPDFDGKTDEEDILELTDIVQPEEIQAQAETATTDDAKYPISMARRTRKTFWS
jgi:hypothetical protein